MVCNKFSIIKIIKEVKDRFETRNISHDGVYLFINNKMVYKNGTTEIILKIIFYDRVRREVGGWERYSTPSLS